MFDLKNHFKNFGLLIKKVTENKKRISTVLLTGFMISCVPSEKNITDKDINSTLGFQGVETVQTLSSTQIKVTWQKSTSATVTGYHIYDSTLTPEPKLLRTVDKDTVETTLSELKEGFLYRFRVRAIDENNVEDTNVNDKYGIPYGGAQSVSVISSTEVDLNYVAPAGTEAVEAKVYCKNTNAPTYVLNSSISDVNLDKIRITGLVPNIDYTCKVNVVVDGKEDNNIQTVTFKALGRADRLVFVTQPGNGQAGELLTQQPVVHVLDENDNIVSGGPDSAALITLTVAVASPTVGTIRGTAAMNAVAGVADFTDLFMQEAGIKILTATKEDTSSQSFGTAQMGVDSSTFIINPGNVSPTLSTITIDPPSTTLVANGTDAYVVTFTLNDEFGNPVSGIRPQFVSNTVGDFLSQPILNTDAAGQTTGSISTTVADTNGPSTRLLSVSSPAGLDSIQVAAPFQPGPATRLFFTVQPTNSPAGDFGLNQIEVAVQDIQGNTVTTGTDATTSISISIASNVGGANLTGTSTRAAVAGVAIFDDLGIDQTGNGYKLAGSGGILNPVNSNNFNITAGIPRVISMTGPSDVLSGQCSTLITLQLQDFGGNPAKATQNTTVQLAGLGDAVLYSSGSCTGTPLSANVTFTPGTDTRNIYLSSQKVESLTITGTDASSVLTPSSYPILVTPSQMSLLAEAAPPAPPGTDLTVTAGQCSTQLVISTFAADGSPGQMFSPTNISLSGIIGSDAEVFSNATCTNLLNASSFPLALSTETLVYLKDPRGESLLLNAVDPASNIATISLPQSVDVLGSNLDFTGPTTVVAGVCSAVFTITLKDTLGNNVPATADTDFDVVGMSSSPTGQFFTSPSCAGVGSNSTVTVPNGSALTTVYYRGLNAEILNLNIADPLGDMADSQTITLTVSPSDFRIDVAGLAESDTSECAGPFDLKTLDGSGTVANVVEAVTANLSGEGDAGGFFSDAVCALPISSVTFSPGQSSQLFYFKGQYPETSLNITATDNAGVLNSDTQTWEVKADLGWLGAAGVQFSAGTTLLPFRTGFRPVAARVNGVREAMHMAFDPTKQYLYIADFGQHRVLKYDYTNGTFIGWMGRVRKYGGLTITGSSIATPSSAQCISTTNAQPLPGWCLGAGSYARHETTGGFYSPFGITVDDTYVYVSNQSSHTITRLNAETGAFDGWIGFINNVTPTAAATNGPAGCTSAPNNSQTPGWCIGGSSRYHGGAYEGDGRIRYPKGMTTDALYLYVGTERAVLRYDKATGAPAGWIGRVNVTPTGGEVGCTSAVDNDAAPGWCTGGRYKLSDPRNTGGVYNADHLVIDGGFLYVLNSSYGGVINKYNVTTGAYIETLPQNGQWTYPRQMMISGGKFYIAADERIVRAQLSDGLTEAWMGKVANNAGMSGNPGCSSLAPNENTPGWCLGGTQKSGLDEEAFLDHWGIVDDGLGSFLTISMRNAAIKKFDIATGAYQGSMGMESTSTAEWSNDRTIASERQSDGDNDYYRPAGSLVVGDHLYVAEYGNSRIKKINIKTGDVVGSLGGMTTSPTGGSDPACLVANPMSPSPSYCTGALPYPWYTWNDAGMIDDLADGIMRYPYGLTEDGTWLYVTDIYMYRIQRFDLVTGAYGGWIGRVNATPTGGAPGCNSTPNDSFTPGWCFGGRSEVGNTDGALDDPTGIVYVAGNLYVVDSDNHRVSSYNATTGAFNGWIGRVNGSPTGCTVASNGNYNVSTSGWCLGGTPVRANYRNDRGGGFNFDYGYASSIATDGTHLFVGNTRNVRIDKITLGGVFVEAISSRSDQYTNTWQSAPANVAAIGNGLNCSYPSGIWLDGGEVYGVGAQPCSRTGDTMRAWKMDKTSGNMIGWKGGIDANYPPTGGETGCVGAFSVTPGWCTGGRAESGALPGQFPHYLGSVSGDAHFLYITNDDSNRVIRLPK